MIDRIRHNLTATAAPGSGDDCRRGYLPGSLWLDRKARALFVCVEAGENAAEWQEVTGPGESAGASDDMAKIKGRITKLTNRVRALESAAETED